MSACAGNADIHPWGWRAGLLFLVLLACGPFSLVYVAQSIFDHADPALTLSNLLAHESLFRASLVADGFLLLAEVALSIVIYRLFLPVNQAAAMVAAAMRLANACVQGVSLVLKLLILAAASGTATGVGNNPELRAQSVQGLFVAYQQTAHVWEIFFGFHCLAIGYLCIRASNVPSLLGWLFALAGLGYWLNSFGSFIFPDAAALFAMVVGLTALVGEFPLFLWLLGRGWRTRDRAVRTPALG